MQPDGPQAAEELRAFARHFPDSCAQARVAAVIEFTSTG
jgi:hypothetical protein